MDNLTPIENVEYIYMTIPKEYVCIYNKLIVLLADYGIEALKDCKAECSEKNSIILKCWNMFNAAIAARKIGNSKLAQVLITYVKTTITNKYNGELPETSMVFPVKEDGTLTALVDCKDHPSFYVNLENGELIQIGEGDYRFCEKDINHE